MSKDLVLPFKDISGEHRTPGIWLALLWPLKCKPAYGLITFGGISQGIGSQLTAAYGAQRQKVCYSEVLNVTRKPGDKLQRIQL